MTGPEELYSFRALWRQYRACRRNKRNTRNQLAFELDVEANLFRLQAELRAHTYRPGRSICFVSGGPKPREVFAADFRDRVVHHLLVAHQEPVFERRFIHDSFACRRGKGTLAASDRLMTFLRQATANGRRPAWALKLDVASFFPSIDKPTLYDLLAALVRDPELGWLTRTVLFHDPTGDYAFCARDRRASPPGTPGYPISLRKSLFKQQNRCGLPIGNLTSQFWARGRPGRRGRRGGAGRAATALAGAVAGGGGGSGAGARRRADGCCRVVTVVPVRLRPEPARAASGGSKEGGVPRRAHAAR